MKQKFAFIIIFAIILKINAFGQDSKKIGIIVSFEDSITQQYIGFTIMQLVNAQYPKKFDLENFTKEEAIKTFKRIGPDLDFVEIEKNKLSEYYISRRTMKSKLYKEFRAEWFNKLKEEHGIDGLVIIENTKSMTDYIHHSKYPIEGYGIYNGPYKNMNNVFIKLQVSYMNEENESKFLGTRYYSRDKKYPRITKKQESLSEVDIENMEEPLKRLIGYQILETANNLDFQTLVRKRKESL